MRIEPAPSEPWASGPRPVATAAPAPPARGPRRAVQLPGISTRRPDEVVAHVLVPGMRGVGLADDDPARRLGALGDDAIEVGNAGFEELRAIGTTQARYRLQILDGNRYSMQQAEIFASHDGRFGGPRRFEGTIGIDGEEGVDLPIQGLDSGQDGLDEFDRRYVPGADCGGELRRWRKAQLIVHGESRRDVSSRPLITLRPRLRSCPQTGVPARLRPPIARLRHWPVRRFPRSRHRPRMQFRYEGFGSAKGNCRPLCR